MHVHHNHPFQLCHCQLHATRNKWVAGAQKISTITSQHTRPHRILMGDH